MKIKELIFRWKGGLPFSEESKKRKCAGEHAARCCRRHRKTGTLMGECVRSVTIDGGKIAVSGGNDGSVCGSNGEMSGGNAERGDACPREGAEGKHVMSPDALQRLPAGFWACFSGQLVAIRGIDIFDRASAEGGDRMVEYATGTGGWNYALRQTCAIMNCMWFYEEYERLDWMDSDEFDCDILDELIYYIEECEAAYSEVAGRERHAYYIRLVNAHTISETFSK